MKRIFSRPWLAGLLCTLALPAWAAFTDNGDGTITDTTTGLMWDKCSRGQVWDNTIPPGTCTGAPGPFHWEGALAEAAVANTASHRNFTDWRLPNRTELESLVKIDVFNPAIDSTVFPVTATPWYWSSTTYAVDPDYAWFVGFDFANANPDAKSQGFNVRLVRSGQRSAAFDALDASVPVLGPPGVTGTTATTTTLQATSDEAATGYWIAVPQGSAAPTAAQVKAGLGYGAVTLAAAGNGPMAAAVSASFSVTGLTASTLYTLYLVAEDASANLSAPSSLFIATLAPPVAGRLNDTGQTQCYDGSVLVACTAAYTGDASTHPRQDGRFGRDRAGIAKVGGGAAGFDFTKICWNGDAEGSGTCTGPLVANNAASASGTPGTDWACTKDNHTNLIWSLQTAVVANWDDATSVAGGSPIATYNSASRCGFNTGWRVPTRRELLSIVHHGAAIPAIDVNYFPGTAIDWYFTNDSNVASSSLVWRVHFSNGHASGTAKLLPAYVRLVRSAQ